MKNIQIINNKNNIIIYIYIKSQSIGIIWGIKEY